MQRRNEVVLVPQTRASVLRQHRVREPRAPTRKLSPFRLRVVGHEAFKALAVCYPPETAMGPLRSLTVAAPRRQACRPWRWRSPPRCLVLSLSGQWRHSAQASGPRSCGLHSPTPELIKN